MQHRLFFVKIIKLLQKYGNPLKELVLKCKLILYLYRLDDELDVVGSPINSPRSSHNDSGSESSCSESMTIQRLPSNTTNDYPSPNISVGPPIHPGPHLLPYLYPASAAAAAAAAAAASLYSAAAVAAANNNDFFSNVPTSASNLLLNAQLALAASNQQHQQHLFFPGANVSAHQPMEAAAHYLYTQPNFFKNSVRFSPYSLPSAFDAISAHKIKERHCSTPPHNSQPTTPTTMVTTPASSTSSTTPSSELKNIENMVNGLDEKS